MASSRTKTPRPPTSKAAQRRAKGEAARLAMQQAERRRRLVTWVASVVVGVLVVGGLFLIWRTGETSPAGGSGRYEFDIGEPGAGEQAIDFTLPATTGGEVNLADLRGKTVLLYWHEGLGCQPCWDQIRDIEADMATLEAEGIDEFYSITSGPADLIAQKMTDDGLTSTALADSDLAVSKQYQMNQYGMMGDSANGHSFLLVGPDGAIQWRADYGGPPNFTMYVPVDQVIADMRAGRQAA